MSKKQCPICGKTMDRGCTITSDRRYVLCVNDGTGRKMFDSYLHPYPKRKSPETKETKDGI